MAPAVVAAEDIGNKFIESREQFIAAQDAVEYRIDSPVAKDDEGVGLGGIARL